MKRTTCMIVFAGRMLLKNSPWTVATCSQSSIRVSRILMRVTSESLPSSASHCRLDYFKTPSGLTRCVTLRDGLAFWRQWCRARHCDNVPGSHCSRDSYLRLEWRSGRNMLASAGQSDSSFQVKLTLHPEPSCQVPAFLHRWLRLTLHKNPESESVRDQQ